MEKSMLLSFFFIKEIGKIKQITGLDGLRYIMQFLTIYIYIYIYIENSNRRNNEYDKAHLRQQYF